MILITNEELAMKGLEMRPIEKTLNHSLSPEFYAREIVAKYGMNLRGSGKKITIKFDPDLGSGTGRLGRTLEFEEGLIIRFGADALESEAILANTLAHELSHVRDYLRGASKANPDAHKAHGNGLSVADGTVYGAGNALQEYIEGKR